MRLYCLPYAGGSAERIYAGWQHRLAGLTRDRVEVVPVELPGRGSRMGESPVPLADALVAGVVQQILPWRETPFALFGHSLGAMLAAEVARVLQHRHGVPAAALMVSGAGAPGPGVSGPADWLLPDTEFRERVRGLAGTPPAVLENDDLMAMFLPVLRADFAVAGQLCGRGGRPISSPITVFGGDRDSEVPVARLGGWAAHSTADCVVRVLSGGHFFLDDLSEQVIAEVARRLRAAEAAPSAAGP
ncbi:thioesterase II family protein [Streptomyces sp. PSAA01]|uniref:thioesterase II family protein n=1 Tax=Streptomyces sp. PSAA01 TaxID=2912762 RepID=UPI001F2450C5|nr:alpha/beta fold hydrolase [Streptomyces sp. PSAA01]MCG0283774.1 alpha/beta fold hydrolase [Streptomyces sp. PSAA01]